jgi:hypothetical protein
MRPVTDRFLAALRRSHHFRTEVELTEPGEDGPRLLDLIEGSLTIDGTAQQRSRATLTIPKDDVSTTGSEVVIRTGLVYPDNEEELIVVATLRVDDAETSETEAKTTLTCVDRSQTVADDHLIDPVAFSAVSTIESGIVSLVTDVLPSVGVTTPGHAETFGEATVVEQEDRWQKVTEWAATLGCVAFFDAGGDFVLADVPDFSDAAAWTVDAGDDGVLVTYVGSVTRRGVFNGVLASGQPVNSTKPPVRFLAVDDDPDSPTYWDGPYGHVLAYLTGETITTNAQAQRAAEALLAQLLGVVKQVDLSAIPNPALEPGDALAVILADGTIERHLIGSLSFPLATKGAFTLKTRSA